MKKSKRYIKKQNNKPLINKKVLAKVMGRRFYGFNNRFRTTKNTEAIVFENGGFVGNLGLSKKLWKKYIEASYKYRTNTDKMTASDYTHLFGYLNPYYRSAYNIPNSRQVILTRSKLSSTVSKRSRLLLNLRIYFLS